MTDTQLIAIAIVFVAALGSIMYNNARITDLRGSMEGRFSSMEGRFSSLDKRIDDMRDSVNRHIDDKFNLLNQKLDHIIEMLASHHERISKLENRQ